MSTTFVQSYCDSCSHPFHYDQCEAGVGSMMEPCSCNASAQHIDYPTPDPILGSAAFASAAMKLPTPAYSTAPPAPARVSSNLAAWEDGTLRCAPTLPCQREIEELRFRLVSASRALEEIAALTCNCQPGMGDQNEPWHWPDCNTNHVSVDIAADALAELRGKT